MALSLRRPLLGPRAGDLALAGILTAYGQAELWAIGLGPKSAAVPATLVATGALVWRRRRPLPATLTVFAALTIEALLGVSLQKANTSLAVVLVTMYSLAAYAPLEPALAGLAVALGLAWLGDATESGASYSDYLFTFVLVGAGWLVGRAMHGRVRSFERRASELQRTSEAERQAAVTAERLRIARELHDLIAHSLSVMVVQAGAAEEVARRQPERVVEPLRQIQETGRQALAEMSRLLGILRGGEELGLAPQPGLGNLEALLEQTRAAGLPVELAVEGPSRPLPPGPDLSAYRIVQEALTNARKHAGPATAQVRLRYRDTALEIEVVDDGPGSTNGAGGGNGLIGMRERVSVFGGELETGPRAAGGYRVRATLPLEQPSA